MPVLLLAFDTATPAVTVAVTDGSAVLAERTSVDARRHGELLAPAIVAVLADAGVARTALTGVAVGVGPGPFTGLRVGLVTAVTLGSALSVPVVGVCSLDALAAAVRVEGPFAVATDARRREVYHATYADARTPGSAAVVARPGDLGDVRLLPTAGQGPELYPQDFPHPTGPRLPGAGALALLAAERLRAGGDGLLAPVPLYLRRPDATAPGPRKPVSPR